MTCTINYWKYFAIKKIKHYNKQMDNNNLNISKIRTGVSGFDDLFYGGLRLPGWNRNNTRDGICIVIYGSRGISKSDLAMQIMRGVDFYFKRHPIGANTLRPKYKTLNHRESELRKKYVGLEVGEIINNIKLPDVESREEEVCRICRYFPRLRDNLGATIEVSNPPTYSCTRDISERCPICKLLRHEIINYSDRSQSMHWTYGEVSDASNLIDVLEEDAIQIGDIFDIDNNDIVSSRYLSIPYRQFKEFMADIDGRSSDDNRREKNRQEGFRWSAYVIEGFTAFRDDELERLPYSDLILKLRKAAAVSILVFDERGKKLPLNADIIIHMQQSMDNAAQYTYHQLQVVKSDIQQHVHGWHKYRKLRDLSVKIYPSLHSLLTRRFSSDNAVLRLEQDNMRFPQPLLNKFSHYCVQHGVSSTEYASTLRKIMRLGEGRGVVYAAKNSALEVRLIESDNYKTKYQDIFRDVREKDSTLAVFLLGKTDQCFRKFLSEEYLPIEALKNIHYWETTLGCIWAEEYASIVKSYIGRWGKRAANNASLHVVFDDFANINLFPLMNRESLLIPALVSICRTASLGMHSDGNVKIIVSFVCTNPNTIQRHTINQIINNQ